jgi:glycosyltransferase involved in cell wall biosynthesis
VTAVSATHADLIAQGYRIPRHRISIVHNGVMDPAEPPPPGAEKAFDLIHLGAPRPYYDTPSLLQALAQTRDQGVAPRTVFLGCLDDEYTTEARQDAEELGLSDTVEFLAPVPWEEVPSMLARARVGLYSHCPDPIYDCALGVKLFEYMQAGLPIAALAGGKSEAARVLTECGCGFAASDPASYAKSLADLLRSPDTVSTMGAAAREASRDFTWDEMIARFYRETLRPLAGA